MTASSPTLVIQPTRGWRSIDLRELWAYRELLYIFAWRDVKVRYRQTFLGALWVMGQPLISVGMFTLLFNRVARIRPNSDIPYTVFVLSGLLMWNFFSAAVSRAGNSLIGASYLISKIYFPRLLVPISSIVTEFVDFGVSAVLLIALMAWYGIAPSAGILLTPLILLLMTLLSSGVSFWLSALNIEYRDVRVVVPFLMQLAMYAAPVAYPLEAVPAKYRPFIVANPMTGVVESFRAAMFGTHVSTAALTISVVSAVVLFLSGAYYFRRMERLFADLL